MNRIFKMMMVATAGLALAFGLAACSGEGGYSGPVAATVNGEEIYEEQVTENVASYMSMFGTDDYGVFVNQLYEMDTDPATLREQTIDTLAQNMLIRQAAENNGIKLDQAYVENTLEQYKSQFESEDQTWEDYLASSGTTEDEVRSQIADSYFQQQVMQKLVATPVPTDEQVQKAIDENIASYGGKRSSHILFNEEDKDKAEDVLQQLKGGADFAELAKEYSQDTGSAENGGDVGWDGDTSFVEEYQTALDGLSVGEMTQELVKSEYGYHIILCTDERTFDENTTYTRDDIPDDIYQEIYLDLQNSLQQQAYSDYIQKLKDEAEIVINDMPASLPYNMTKEEAAAAAEAAEAAAAAEAEAAETEAAAGDDAAAEGDAAKDGSKEGAAAE
ncbi:MAG: peptidylprolyl isomerase [Coriobacteriales bacterium]|jgi:foldase protein PrsA